MNTSGPLLEASISAYPFVAVHPKHQLDLSPPRLAFAAREKSLRHRLLRETKLFTLPLALPSDPSFSLGLGKLVPLCIWDQLIPAKQRIVRCTGAPGRSQDSGLKDAQKAAVVTAKPLLTDSEFPAPGGTRNRSGPVALVRRVG